MNSASAVPATVWRETFPGAAAGGVGVSRRQVLRWGVQGAGAGILLWSGGCSQVGAAVPVKLAVQITVPAKLAPILAKRFEARHSHVSVAW